jgi:hypothetical protein
LNAPATPLPHGYNQLHHTLVEYLSNFIFTKFKSSLLGHLIKCDALDINAFINLLTVLEVVAIETPNNSTIMKIVSPVANLLNDIPTCFSKSNFLPQIPTSNAYGGLRARSSFNIEHKKLNVRANILKML